MNSIVPLVPPTPSQGDALGREFAQHDAHLRRLAQRNLAADLAAKVAISDVVQDTFCAASRDRRQYRGNSPREFRGWLEGILRNRLLYLHRYFRGSARRQVSREVELGGTRAEKPGLAAGEVAAPTTLTPLSRVVQAERTTALRAALAQLNDADAQMIRWHQQDQLPFAAIGDRLGISEDAARKRWARALKRLRDLLGPVDESR